MHLIPFEQSGFIFETNSGFRLALDIASKTPVEMLENMKVDAFLVSHIHGDHFSLEHIKKLSPKRVYLNQECLETLGEEELPFELVKIKKNQTIRISPDIAVQTFNVDHGPNISAPLVENFGFLITVDGTTIYFAGDMFYESGIDVNKLEVDYALIPIGGHYVFGPAEAFKFVKNFKDIKKLIPMHYGYNPEALGEFKKAVGDSLNLI